jgi:hypothetical protein
MRSYRPGLRWARLKHSRVFSKVAWRLIVVASLLQTSMMASWAQPQSPPADVQGADLPTLAPLVKKVGAAIVNIAVRERVPVQEPSAIDPASRQFPDAPYSSTASKTKAAGVVVDAHEGLIVTNDHVIEEADDISADLADGIADLFEESHIKRVPIVSKGGNLVGIVSRANIIQVVASVRPRLEISLPDAAIGERLMNELKQQPWAHIHKLNATVTNGVVDLWGLVQSDTERRAITVAAEAIPGVTAVNDHLKLGSASVY